MCFASFLFDGLIIAHAGGFVNSFYEKFYQLAARSSYPSFQLGRTRVGTWKRQDERASADFSTLML
jgi:hypothetical protein